jgi:hypothetical protein
MLNSGDCGVGCVSRRQRASDVDSTASDHDGAIAFFILLRTCERGEREALGRLSLAPRDCDLYRVLRESRSVVSSENGTL